MMGQSHLEAALEFQIRVAGLPEPEREFMFDPTRRWRFDFCWPEHGRIAAECEGGTWMRGRHSRGAGFANDCSKYNSAALLGWKVLRFTAEMISSGRALETLEQALADEGQPALRGDGTERCE